MLRALLKVCRYDVSQPFPRTRAAWAFMRNEKRNPVVMEHLAFRSNHPAAAFPRDHDTRHAARACGKQVAQNESIHPRLICGVGRDQI